jgi:hypothetical protein
LLTRQLILLRAESVDLFAAINDKNIRSLGLVENISDTLSVFRTQ